jgi:RNA polymerase sigma-70 factor (ECF subfamily)
MNQDCYNEKDLVSRLKQGSEDAFTTIYNRHWKSLYFLAHKHLKSTELSEEIVQEVFLSLWRYRNSLQIQSLHTYLAAMTRYTVYRFVAREKKSVTATIAGTNEFASSVNEEDFISHKLLLDIIQKLSTQLPEKCRLVFVNNKLLDQPLEQVASDMNISVKTAEAHLTRALKFIRGGLKDASLLFLVI